jgi:hemerythrin-like domain-containing protein
MKTKNKTKSTKSKTTKPKSAVKKSKTVRVQAKTKKQAAPKKRAVSLGKKATLSVPERIKEGFEQAIARITSTLTNQPTDLISAIEQDHEGLRNFIEILKDTKRDMSERRRAYDLFSALLKSHTIAEEKAVYSPLEKPADNELTIRIKEGYVEHAAADYVMTSLEKVTDAKEWSAHANVLAELVEHHLDEEEKEMFPLIRKQINKNLEVDATVEFLKLRGETQTMVTPKNAGVLEVLSPS